jgi:hypothetical protein
MAVADFLDRSFDILAWRGAVVGEDQLLDQTLLDATSSGEICTGIQKLAQRFLVELLTPVGSIQYLPERGTGFLGSLLARGGRLSAEIFAAFAIAEVEARSGLLAEETDTDPDDERYLSAQLLEVNLQPAAVFLRFRLTSRANTTVFIAPISIVP